MATITMKPKVSGIPATVVTRWAQKWSVPVPAEPRPRTRPSGVRMLMVSLLPAGSADEEITRHPQHDRAGDRGKQRGGGQPVALARPEAAAGVPDEMADAAEGVMEQGPGVA